MDELTDENFFSGEKDRKWAENRRYGIVIDAGSSGSRVQVYSWLEPVHARSVANATELDSLPVVVKGDRKGKNWQKKIHVGISTFADSPDEVGDKHIKLLLDHAASIVPPSARSTTPVFLLATAGMRLLEEDTQAQILSNVCSYITDHTDFWLPHCDMHVQVISGTQEGLYGWIAINYLMGGIDHPEIHEHGDGHHTYGFLDMGGASAQIAFAPNTTETIAHNEDLQFLRLRTLDGRDREFRVFVSTWLGFGANEARRRYCESLAQKRASSSSSQPLLDPCLPLDYTYTDAGTKYLGTGSLRECLDLQAPLLDKNIPCDDEPCLFAGVHAPSIDFDVNHFVGVSEYWHSSHDVFDMGGAYDYVTYSQKVEAFCARPWREIQIDIDQHTWGHKMDEETVGMLCFKASWMMNVPA